jgi:flagellin
MRINTNVEAFNAQRNLSATSLSYAKSVEKLSSGLRINRAGDDAAGLSISEKMRAQIKGLAQAQRNAQDGISMIQTGEGALTEVHSMLQRMRELSVQGSNDTLSDEDRTAINTELQQLKSEIDATRDRTKFNGKALLTGSLSTSLNVASTAQTGLVVHAGTNTSVASLNVASAAAGKTFTFTDTATGLQLSDGTVTQEIADANLAVAANGSLTLNYDKLGVSLQVSSITGATAANVAAGLTTKTVVTAAGNAAANLQIGAGSADAMSVSFSEISVDTLDAGGAGLDTILTTLNGGVGSRTVANFQSLMGKLDNAINFVSDKRATLGAAQNRLEHTIANLGVAQENLSASESRIRDVDMAAEMVNFTKTGILQQAGQAILAQANQAPQGVLSLLR